MEDIWRTNMVGILICEVSAFKTSRHEAVSQHPGNTQEIQPGSSSTCSRPVLRALTSLFQPPSVQSSEGPDHKSTEDIRNI